MENKPQKQLHNNRRLAAARLRGLIRKLQREEIRQEKYDKAIRQYLRDGYAG